MNTIDAISDLNRREFIKGSTFATAMMMLGAVPLRAEDKPDDGKPTFTPVNIGIIGCGAWSRDIIAALTKLKNAPVALCDHYEASLNKAKNQVSGAEAYADCQKLLADKNVKAVIVAVPSHLHKQIVLDALAAGKHVYCEAPIATTIEDSRAIAQAAEKAVKQYFQPGLLYRSDPQMSPFLLNFVRSGATGQPIKAYSQWHKQNSWRKTSPNPERELELNWRLDKKTSIGLVGEIGIQQLDVANWFYRANPVAVTGFGTIKKWKEDGRDVPDTIQAAFEYPDDVIFNYMASLGNSFDGMLDIYYGTYAALMMRDGRAWMFKEPDAPLLGWEVYAQKNSFYKETGISLMAGASKLDKQIEKVTDPRPDAQEPIYYALEAFLRKTNLVEKAVKSYSENYDAEDLAGMKTYIADQRKNAVVDAATTQEGHAATVAVIKGNEAILKRERVVMSKEWFSL